MGVFVGIIVGFVGVIMFNNYYNFCKLLEVFIFFNGKCFVFFVVIFCFVIVVIFLVLFWLIV